MNIRELLDALTVIVADHGDEEVVILDNGDTDEDGNDTVLLGRKNEDGEGATTIGTNQVPVYGIDPDFDASV